MTFQNDPLVSIFMITYNHEKFIAKAIESVLMQKTNFQVKLFIGEDFSTDKTRDICLAYKTRYPEKIDLILNNYNLGAILNAKQVYKSCINSGAKYIAMLEGDDYWTDIDKLQKQVDFLDANEEYSMCFHDADVINKKGFLRKFNGINKDRDFNLIDLTQSNFISSASVVFRKKNIEKFPDFFEQLQVGDWGFHLLNAEKGKIRYFKDCMSVYRQHDGGIWSSLNHKEMVLKGVELMKQLDKCFDYKYHEYFQKGIDKKLMALNTSDEKIKISTASKIRKAIKRIIRKPNRGDNFTRIYFSTDNLDKYLIRTSIFNAIKEILPQLKGKLLDIGCGKMPYRTYILKNSEVNNYAGLDIEGALEYDANIKPDFTWDGNVMPFDAGSFDCIFATEVLEHCQEPEIVLKEAFRVLMPGGIFFFTVPFLWNLHEVPHDEYRLTPFAMERHLKSSGFKVVSIKATGGWHASLAQMMGLWVRRAPIKRNTRIILSYLFKPIVKYLINQDKKLILTFNEGQMITGLYGVAKK
jgi:glycosyltransferase involved in cell wall biosynthesis